MTDSICHSLLPRTVLEKVTLTTIQFCIHPRTKVDPMFQCVYISTPLKSCPYKSSATCPRRLISTFVVRCSSFFFFFFFSTKKPLTNLNGEQNDTWNVFVSRLAPRPWCHVLSLLTISWFKFMYDILYSQSLIVGLWHQGDISKISCCYQRGEASSK